MQSANGSVVFSSGYPSLSGSQKSREEYIANRHVGFCLDCLNTLGYLALFSSLSFCLSVSPSLCLRLVSLSLPHYLSWQARPSAAPRSPPSGVAELTCAHAPSLAPGHGSASIPQFSRLQVCFFLAFARASHIRSRKAHPTVLPFPRKFLLQVLWQDLALNRKNAGVHGNFRGFCMKARRQRHQKNFALTPVVESPRAQTGTKTASVAYAS